MGTRQDPVFIAEISGHGVGAILCSLLGKHLALHSYGAVRGVQEATVKIAA